MERLKRSFRNSFRRKKSSAHQTESSKPHQWSDDEIAVRNGNCSFPVKYLGCVQVLDSRGMHICEQALLTLKAQKKSRSIKGQLYISGDGLRVVDDETKGLIVDQTIEKVSFCAPDRNHDRGFSYICRDGTTRRWMCHGFLASKDTGDRLSHAVGCSFAVCLERKQKRDAKLTDPKTANNNSSMNSVGSSINNSSVNSEANADSNNKQQFTRTGSFRRIPIKQRMKDPQECKLIEPLPVKEVRNPYAIERPHATPQLLERQGSCRIFKGLNHQNSPFKRQLSLRFSTPSQQEKHQRKNSLQTQDSMFNKYTDSSINNFSSNSTEQPTNDYDITNMCKNITENLNILSNNMRDNEIETKNKLDLFEDNFQFNNTKSPVIAKANVTSSIASVSKTPTPDYLTNSTHDSAHKTIINVDSNSLFKKNSSVNYNERTKFGQLTLNSYLDESFFKDSLKDQSTANKPNGIIFTDLDEPFEANFEKANITKVDVGDQLSLSNNKSSLNNSSINSLSNSLTSSLNDTSVNMINRNNLKTMNKINLMNNDYLISELNNVNKINTSTLSNGKTNQLTNNNNIMNKKLNEKDLFDPFNSDWVSTLSKNELDLNKSTNPFLQSNMGSTVNTYKTFELKM